MVERSRVDCYVVRLSSVFKCGHHNGPSLFLGPRLRTAANTTLNDALSKGDSGSLE